MKDFESENYFLEGIVTPSDWDSKGGVLGIHIALENEINIPLILNYKSQELQYNLGAVVKVFGRRIASKFIVERYKVIKPFQGEVI